MSRTAEAGLYLEKISST